VHLRSVELTDWIAADRAAYVRIAQEKASAPAHLATLRAALRARVESSPLMDGAGFARDFCAVLRTLWQNACTRQ
jgi:predicted O-linked N-acetylglucosamine transferase (SPINDLY family)